MLVGGVGAACAPRMGDYGADNEKPRLVTLVLLIGVFTLPDAHIATFQTGHDEAAWGFRPAVRAVDRVGACARGTQLNRFRNPNLGGSAGRCI